MSVVSCIKPTRLEVDAHNWLFCPGGKKRASSWISIRKGTGGYYGVEAALAEKYYR
jgi:hypothetical protein